MATASRYLPGIKRLVFGLPKRRLICALRLEVCNTQNHDIRDTSGFYIIIVSLKESNQKKTLSTVVSMNPVHTALWMSRQSGSCTTRVQFLGRQSKRLLRYDVLKNVAPIFVPLLSEKKWQVEKKSISREPLGVAAWDLNPGHKLREQADIPQAQRARCS